MYQLIQHFNFIMVTLFICNYTAHFVYSPLNSYVNIHWILDFKYLMLCVSICIVTRGAVGARVWEVCVFHADVVCLCLVCILW